MVQQKLKVEADKVDRQTDSISDWPVRNCVLREVNSACKDIGQGEFKVFS